MRFCCGGPGDSPVQDSSLAWFMPIHDAICQRVQGQFYNALCLISLFNEVYQSDFTKKDCVTMRLIPRKLFLTRGVGVHREKLTSFEMALR